MVHPWVGDNDQAGFFEGASDIVGEGTWSETTSHSYSTCMLSKFENGTLTVGTSGNDHNIGRVLDGSDYSGSKDNLFPYFANIDDINT